MTAVEDFGGSPDDFDLDAWLDQATRPRREVTIYRDWGLLAEYDRLVAAQDDSADDDAMGEESVADRIADVLARMEASKLVLTVEALTQAEVKSLADKAPKVTVEGPDGKTREKVDEVALGDAIAAASVISHDLSADQVRRMREKLGDGPMHALYRAVADLRTAGQVLPEVPSSREH